MSIPAKSGVYLLCSADSFGKRVYKVGRSENLKQRLASYPPNFMVLGIFPCELHEEMESKIIQGFRSKFKIYARNEYFEIDAEYNKISSVFYEVISSTKLPKKETKKVAEKKEVSKSTVQELKSYVLESHGGAITRKEMEDSAKSYNTLITFIMQRHSIDKKEELLKGIAGYLKEIVPNKEVKKYKEGFSQFDLKLINRNHLIKPSDVDKAYQ